MSMSEQAALNTCSKDNAITLLRKEVCMLKGEVNRLNRLLTHERSLTNVGDGCKMKINSEAL